MPKLTDMQSKEWQEEIIANIGRAMEKAREGKSDRWIAERTDKLGNPLSRTAVSEYRRGVRKSVSVTDWLTLAAALGIPPISLLLPELPDGNIDLLPVLREVNQLDALMWIAGERQTLPSGCSLPPSPDSNARTGEVSGRRDYRSDVEQGQGPLDLHDELEPSREQSLLIAVRHMRKVLNEIRAIRGPFEVFEHLGDEASKQQAIELYIKRMQKKQAELAEVEAWIVGLGGVIQDEQVVEHNQDGER